MWGSWTVAVSSVSPKSKLAEIHIPAETPRNPPKRPKHPEILPEVEWGVVSYRFAYRYQIFRPFRPEWNGIYNYGWWSEVETIEKKRAAWVFTLN